MANLTSTGFPGLPHMPSLGRKEPSFITPPELQRASYAGSPLSSDRETIENSGANVESCPGSGMPGEAWERPKPPQRSGLRR